MWIQLALLLLAIGVLVVSIRVVRSSPKGDLARPLKFLHWGFWGSVASFALAMAADRLFPASDAAALGSGFLTNALLAVFFVFACFYWTSLGVLAHRLGQSAAIWIVAGLATFAIGFIATYLMMGSRARREVARASGKTSVAPGS
jgi:hypothetical protein